jgi:hypothetical protein
LEDEDSYHPWDWQGLGATPYTDQREGAEGHSFKISSYESAPEFDEN